MTDDSPTRIAVIGSGPAGFYAAGHLLKDPDANIDVDMLERLPTPWGLVRFGVAPDHPKIKSVTRIYEKTAAYGHFGRNEPEFTWERTDRSDALRQAAGLKGAA